MPEQRRPVVLLHGAGLMPTMWQPQVEALGAQTRAIAPWVAGLRPGRRQPLSLTGAGADVIGVLDRSGYATADLVAHQLGAMVALQCAADHPDRVGRLVLSGALLLPGRMALTLQKAAIRMMPAARIDQTGATKDDLIRALDLMAEADFSQRLGQITAPTLVILGAGDQAGRPSAEILADKLPDGRLAVVPDAASTPSVENPEAYNRLLVEFLEEPADGS